MIHGAVEKLESRGSSLIVSFISSRPLGKKIAFRATAAFLLSPHYFSWMYVMCEFLGTQYVSLSKLLTVDEQDSSKGTDPRALHDSSPTLSRWTPAVDQHHVTVVLFFVGFFCCCFFLNVIKALFGLHIYLFSTRLSRNIVTTTRYFIYFYLFALPLLSSLSWKLREM